jgi:hypothetical protein
MTPAIIPCHGFSVIAKWQEQGRRLEKTAISPATGNQNYFKPKWRYLQLPKSGTAVDSVIGTAMKRRIHRHLKYLDQRPLKSPKILQTITFSSGVVDTTPPKHCSAVSTTPQIYISLVSLTPKIKQCCLH